MPTIGKMLSKLIYHNGIMSMSFLEDSKGKILICNADKPTEHYIDTRTHRNEDNVYVVKPIVQSYRFFCYVCPFCQMIHTETCRWLSRKNVRIPVRCKHLKKLKLSFFLDAPIAEIAVQVPEIVDLYDQIVQGNMEHADYVLIEEFEQDDSPKVRRKRRIPPTRA